MARQMCLRATAKGMHLLWYAQQRFDRLALLERKVHSLTLHCVPSSVLFSEQEHDRGIGVVLLGRVGGYWPKSTSLETK
jgi:hypothetical protein